MEIVSRTFDGGNGVVTDQELVMIEELREVVADVSYMCGSCAHSGGSWSSWWTYSSCSCDCSCSCSCSCDPDCSGCE
jgi:hypothetical protein